MSWPHLAGPRLSLSSKVTSSDITEGRRAGSRGFWSELVHRGGTSGIPCPRSMHAGAVSHSKLYIFGGYDGYQRSNDLYTYDFSTNVWTLLNASGTIPPRRDRHTAVVYLNTLVIFGGYDGRTRLNDIHTLDLQTKRWETVNVTGMQEVPSPRHSHAAVVYGQSMFIFGGYDGHYCGDLYQFNFSSFSWSKVRSNGDAPSPRYRVTCCIHGDFMIVHGGHDGNRHLNETHVFDFLLQCWSPLLCVGVPPSPRDSHVGIVMQGVMYIFGGSTGGALEDFHSLNLETYTWAPVCVANSTPNFFSFPGSRTNRAQDIFMSSSATFTSSSCVDDAVRGPIIRIGTGMNAWSMPNISPDISIEVRRTGSPGNRFCHIAVVHCGSIYSFGGYDGSKRLNDFLKFSLTPDNLIVDIPSSTLVEDLRGFVGSDFQSDVTFIVEGKRVRAHKILCMRCPYFRNMFRGEYMESREEEIIIAEVGYETFFKLLEFLYSDHCEVNSINVVDLFQAADRFGVERLKKICESALINLLDVDSVCDIFLLGDSYNGELLKSESIAFIVTHFDQVSRSAGFEEMARENMDVLFQILRLR